MRKPKFPNLDEIDCDSLDPEQVEAARNETPVIFSYSRAEALADGTLRDAGDMAVMVGFRYPVALTSAAWEKVISVPHFALCESEEGRLWDVLNILRWAAKDSHGDELEFSVEVTSQTEGTEEVQLRAVCGAGDDGRPVITVMLRHED